MWEDILVFMITERFLRPIVPAMLHRHRSVIDAPHVTCGDQLAVRIFLAWNASTQGTIRVAGKARE